MQSTPSTVAASTRSLSRSVDRIAAMDIAMSATDDPPMTADMTRGESTRATQTVAVSAAATSTRAYRRHLRSRCSREDVHNRYASRITRAGSPMRVSPTTMTSAYATRMLQSIRRYAGLRRA